MKSPRPGKRWTASSEVLWIGIYPAEVNQDPRAESETRQCRVSTEGGTQFMMALMSAGGRVGDEPGCEGAVECGQGERWGGESLHKFDGVLKLGLKPEDLIRI